MKEATEEELADIATEIGIVDPVVADRMPEEWPDPSPAIVERAQRIVSGVVDEQIVEVEVISEEDRVCFLRHLLTGDPFTKTYDSPTGVSVTFTADRASKTVSADRAFARHVQDLHISTGEAKILRSLYTMAHAVSEIQVPGDRIRIPEPGSSVQDIEQWADTMPEGVLSVVRAFYNDFHSLFSRLVTKATGDDPSFWPTLS